MSTAVQEDDLAWTNGPDVACRGAPVELFIGNAEAEPAEPPAEALGYCNLCPVRSTCLGYALRRVGTPDEVVGVWGGTSSYQRRQLVRRRSRVTCPSCRSRSLTNTDANQLCLACGMSWSLLPEEV